MTDLVVYGAGAMGRVVKAIVDDINDDVPRWNLIGFLDDSSELRDRTVADCPVLGGASWLQGRTGVAVIVAVGSPSTRFRVVQTLSGFYKGSFATLVHPSALIGQRTCLGSGTIVFPGAVIDPDVAVGCHVIINKLCTVGHDSVINDYVTLSPSVSLGGHVNVGVGCEFGMKSCVIQGLTIGEWSILGAGAVAVANIPANVTAVGVPTRIVKERSAGWHIE